MALIEDRPAVRPVVDLRQDAAVVAVHGEVDDAAAHRLQDDVAALLDGGAVRVVIDLRDGSFADSVGLGAFVSALTHLRDRGGGVSVAAPTPDVLRLLEISGVTRMVPVVLDPDHLHG